MSWHHAKDVPAGLNMKVQNRSLYAAKYADVPERKEDKTLREASLRHLVEMKGDTVLTALFRESRKGWRRTATAELRLTLAARLVVNHAGGVLENAGLALDRLTGEPYIPGSALKGIAREAARTTDANQAEITVVFGYEKESCRDVILPDGHNACAGSVAFLPAFPVTDATLELDVVTCHHPEYYSGKQPRALDNESPIPNVFPVVKPGVEFMFALAPLSPLRAKAMTVALGLPDSFDPLAKAKQWLIAGLTEQGVGAKTTAGYGWFTYDEAKESRRAEDAAEKARLDQETAEKKAAEEKRKASLGPVEQAMEEIVGLADGEPFIAVAKTLETKDPDYQRAFFKCLAGPRKETWKRYKKNKPDLAERLRKIAAQLGEILP